MALSFALLICGAPYGTEAASQAYLFAREVIAQGHTLKKVFFYQEGVLNANCLTSPATDEQDLVAGWRTLATQFNVELDVCVAAALRRGVLDHSEAMAAGLSVANVESPFLLSGLGQLAEAALGVDRLVQF
jgi:tRNA 2-thiouridine synthesizing protein D